MRVSLVDMNHVQDKFESILSVELSSPGTCKPYLRRHEKQVYSMYLAMKPNLEAL